VRPGAWAASRRAPCSFPTLLDPFYWHWHWPASLYTAAQSALRERAEFAALFRAPCWVVEDGHVM
jgi:hypothetical protein